MPRLFRSFAAVFLLLVICAIPLHAQRSITPDSAAYQRGRTLTRWLLTGAVDSIYEVMSPEFREKVNGREGMAQLVQRLEERTGEEEEVVREALYREAGHVDYYRISRFSKVPEGTITMRVVWDSAGSVAGAQVTPTPSPAPSQYLDYQTQAALRLPFNGEWYVAWGGRMPHQNKHVGAPDQRFAYDFLILRGGMPHTGKGSANEEHYCWGKPVLAPAAGTVVTTVDSVADNQPGTVNRAAPPGNYVVIDHGNGEFSLLAHLRRGSVVVTPGDRVRIGAHLGECGNSGQSELPHLHYHLQTGPAYRQGVGLPAFFNHYIADGKPIARGEPVRGQTVQQGSSAK